jgi:hypothetical protein
MAFIIMVDGKGRGETTAATIPVPGMGESLKEHVLLSHPLDGAEAEALAISAGIHLAAQLDPVPKDLCLVTDRPASISPMMAMCGHPDGKLKPRLSSAFVAVLRLCLQDMRWAFEILGAQSIVIIHRSMLAALPGWKDSGLQHHRLGGQAHRAYKGERLTFAAFVEGRMEEHRDRVMDHDAVLQWKLLHRNKQTGLIQAAQVWRADKPGRPFEISLASLETVYQSMPLNFSCTQSVELFYLPGGSLRQQLREREKATYFSVRFDLQTLRNAGLLQEEGLRLLEDALIKVVGREVQHEQRPKTSGEHLNSMELQFRGLWRTWTWCFTVGVTDFDKHSGKRNRTAVPHAYVRAAAWVLPYAADYLQDALDICTQ